MTQKKPSEEWNMPTKFLKESLAKEQPQWEKDFNLLFGEEIFSLFLDYYDGMERSNPSAFAHTKMAEITNFISDLIKKERTKCLDMQSIGTLFDVDIYADTNNAEKLEKITKYLQKL